jgi:hypothetical protein
MFEEAVQALVDEAASIALSAPESETTGSSLQTWSSRVIAEAERMLDHLDGTFGERPLETLTAAEVEAAASPYLAQASSPATEQFLGGLLNKIKTGISAVTGLASKVAGAGLGVLGKIVGLGPLVAVFRKMVRPLVKRVVSSAMGLVPASLRPAIATLAQKLGVQLPGSAGEIADEFDRHVASALTAPNEAAAERILAEAETVAAEQHADPIRELDAARSQLAEGLAASAPGVAPTVEVEQFIPAVMAAMPLIRTAVRLLGRDRIKNLLAGPIAAFVAPFVGDAAKALAPSLADAGMKLLSLEYEEPARLGTEALVSTVEETVRQVLSLPEESLAQDVRVSAEVQEAFAEAAARYLPAGVLRADLDSGESETGGWVLMPRGSRRAYRYRAWAHPIRVLVTRPVARTIVLIDGETLEEQLLEQGTGSWPVQAEVRLYETMPGTQLGHLTAGETASGGEAAFGRDDLGELTPEVAGTLLGAPAMGIRPGPPVQGRRYFRVLIPGRPSARRRVHRFAVRLDLTGQQPVLRVHLRIGERTAHALVGQASPAGQRTTTAMVATFRQLLGPAARDALARRLRRVRSFASRDVDQAVWGRMATSMAEAMTTAVAQAMPAVAAELMRAAQDPATGLTVTFTFAFADRAAIPGGALRPPTLVVRPGHHHD